MSAIRGGAVVPTAPLVLPAASHEQPAENRDEVARLRALTREAMESLPTADVHVLVTSGPRGIYDRAHATLRPLGVEGADAELPVDEGLVEHLSRLVQYPVIRGDELDVGLAVLALLLREVRGESVVLPVNVPRGADFDVLVAVGAAIGEAAADAEASVVVLCGGDLSAGLDESSPAYRIDGAPEWDAAVVTAAESGELDGLRDLGPEEADRVHALGWSSLAVLHGVCAAGGLRVEPLGYAPTRGVGHLVARCVGTNRRREERYDAKADVDG